MQFVAILKGRTTAPANLDTQEMERNALVYMLVFLISKIQLVVYYQYCVLIGRATTRLYVIAH